MKKTTFGFIAMAIAAAFPFAAQATQSSGFGDVRAIETSSSVGAHSFPNSVDDPVIAGETVQIKVYMLNVDYETTAGDTTKRSPWTFSLRFPTGVADIDDAQYQQQMYLNPPALGIMVGGRAEKAKIVNSEISSSKQWCTVFTCEYTAKAGDLALPIQLIDVNEDPMGSSSSEFRLYNAQTVSDPFILKGAHLDGSDAVETNLFKYGSVGSAQYDRIGTRNEQDSTLMGENNRAFVKAVDFDDDPDIVGYADSGIWRQIREGSTEVLPYDAYLEIPSGVNTDGVSTVYLRTTDPNVAVLANGNEKELPITEWPNGASGPQEITTTKSSAVKLAIGQTEVSFKLRATGANGVETEVQLSSTPTNIYDAAGTMITNWVSKTIKVAAPPEPSLSISLGTDLKKSLTVAPSTNFDEYACVLNIRLSQAYSDTESFQLDLGAMLDSGNDPYGMKLVAIDDAGDGTWRTTPITGPITIAAGETYKTLYVYAHGAVPEVYPTGTGVKFIPQVSQAVTNHFTGGISGCTLFIDGSKTPFAVTDLDGVTADKFDGVAIRTVTQKAKTTFEIGVADDYRNMSGSATNKYEVVWDTGDGYDPETFTNLTLSASGKLSVSLKYATLDEDGDNVTKVTVTNPDGTKTSFSCYIKVTAPWRATLSVDSKTVNEGAEVPVTVKLSKAYKDDIYVFLVPVNADSSNRVAAVDSGDGFAADGNYGVPVDGTEAVITIRLTDGKGYPKVKAVFLDQETWTDDESHLITSYASDTLSFTVNNVKPDIGDTGIIVNNGATYKDGEITAEVSKDVNTRFTLDWAGIDVTPDLEAVSNKVMVTWWKVQDGKTYTNHYEYGTAWTDFTYKFRYAGTNTVSVYFLDKDMRNDADVLCGYDPVTDTYAYTNKAGASKFTSAYTLKVPVGTTPRVTVECENFEGNKVYETQTDPPFAQQDPEGTLESASFKVSLSPMPSNPVKLKISAIPVNDPVKYDVGKVVLSETNVTISVDSPEDIIYFKEPLDGTFYSQWKFCVEVDPEETGVDENGTLYRNVYTAKTNTFTVVNVAPYVYAPTGIEGTNFVALGETIYLNWNVADVVDDATNDFIVTWQADGAIVHTSTNKLTSADAGNPTTSLSAPGMHTLIFMVKDKDGGFRTCSQSYYVQPSKYVYVYPIGPEKPQTKFTQIYASRICIGTGTVSSENASGSGMVKGLTAAQIFNYSISTRTALFTAMPDDGSYFYGWVLDTASEGGDNTESAARTYYGTMQLISPQFAGEPYNGHISLPTDLGDDSAYEDVSLEMIFAKANSNNPKDGMGDINNDGIPDYFATMVWSTDSGTTAALYTLQNGGDSSGDTDASTSTYDLADVADYNEEDDSTTYDNYTLFDKTWRNWNGSYQVQSWGARQPFTAYDEIRGFGDGLNYQPGTVSQWDLAENEEMALLSDYVTANGMSSEVTNITVVSPEVEITNIISAADNTLSNAYAWAETTGWTCEAQTNPAKMDTDNDGLADGWEYFFWYYAKAGAMVTTSKGVEWRRMVGSKFTLDTYGQGQEISSDLIVKAFDPNVKRSEVNASTFGYDVTDFDEDGLADYEEFVLGTNPCHWDSDGDGISDYWEVINCLNPLSNKDGDRTLSVSDTANNSDEDFMAWQDLTGYTLITYSDGSKYAFEAGSEITLADGETANVYAATTVDGDEYYLDATEQPIVMKGPEQKLYLMKATKAWKKFSYAVDENTEAVNYRGEEVTLKAGVQFKKDPVLETAPVALAKFDSATAFNASLGKNEDTNMAVKVVQYGLESAGKLIPANVDFSVSALPDAAKKMVVSIEKNVTVSLIHYQVYMHNGFDPRTGWKKNSDGYVATRWNGATASDGGKVQDAGLAVNTVAFTSLDEFLLATYRYNAIGKAFEASSRVYNDGDVRCDLKTDQAYLDSKVLSYYDIFAKNTTIPGGTNECVLTTLETVDSQDNGADTDLDGIPDGWELYVNADPNCAGDASSSVGNALDVAGNESKSDKLTFLDEFAGTDSSAAYSNVTTIAVHGPSGSEASEYLKGWFNKFFPTDPYSSDTDGDGLFDHEEGSTRKNGYFWVGRNEYTANFTFKYGKNNGIAADDGSVCVRGGGLNPCTVDTDNDLLPDPWEWEFAGVVFAGTTLGIDSLDLNTLCSADGLQGAYVDGTYEIRGGMDGTNPNDADYDFDHDGLQNFQEYLVQAIRCFRYDDSETPLMGHYLGPNGEEYGPFVPMQAFDGEAFYDVIRKAGYGASSAFKFRELGYFALPPREWDMLALNTRGQGLTSTVGSNVEKGYRIMLRPNALVKGSTAEKEIRMDVRVGGFYGNDYCMYACTDPRRWDSDDDGMDDYYELFHGLNPLLGSVVNPMGSDVSGEYNARRYDRIAMVYGCDETMTSWCNAWTGWNQDSAPAFDAIKYPWMMGTAECDADGDGIRNADEALLVNVTTPSPTHTDPTPLWFTDSTSLDKVSFTAQYYCVPVVSGATDSELCWYPWSWNKQVIWADETLDGRTDAFMFSFEENEGFDTDRDGTNDKMELTQYVDPASDPLKFSDPDRRQALWFDGTNSAAVTYNGGFQRAYSTQYDLLRQFTVECWIKPTDMYREQVILERVADYGASTLSNNTAVIRANFRLGITADGKIYGEYEGNTADSGKVTVIGPVLEEGKWTHVALTMDDPKLSLYIDGDSAPVASKAHIGIIPANGITIMRQEAGESETITEYGYQTVPCAFILGTTAKDTTALTLSAATKWENSFDTAKSYAGWIDEVRVWDGARSGTEIHNAYKQRMSFEDVQKLREEVYEAWVDGARRNDSTGGEVLPAELVQHYNFQTLPGAENADDVMEGGTPVGFRRAVLDNVRVQGNEIETSLFCGWWYSTPVHSEVYYDYHLVPWIQNTCAHLPMMDGSTLDSQYWSRDFAGMNYAQNTGVASNSFNNSANPYSYVIYQRERFNHYFRTRFYTSTSVTNAAQRYQFQLRADFVGTSDLVPLGNAFAKRDTTFWDEAGAMDAWTETGIDSDENGIPDWAETIDFDSVLGNLGSTYTLQTKYLLALANGLLPDGNVYVEFASMVDSDKDGIPDWWEDSFGVNAYGAWDDPDHDGLSMISEYQAYTNGVGLLDPLLMKSNGTDIDYFRRVERVVGPCAEACYLGEIYADCDMMEDDWEDKYDVDVVNRWVWDALTDPDGDGWSNFAECRAGTDPTLSERIYIRDPESGSAVTMGEHPVPTVELMLTRADANGSAGNVIVQAWHSSTVQGNPDAQWVIGESGGEKSRFIGLKPTIREECSCGPGSIVPGTFRVNFLDFNGDYEKYLVNTNTGAKTLIQQLKYDSDAASWIYILFDRLRSDGGVMGDIVDRGSDLVVGSINYQTGFVSIDFGSVDGEEWRSWSSDSDCTVTYLDQSYVKYTWTSAVCSDSLNTKLYLCDPDSGSLKEGRNTFIAFIDENANGAVDIGEPFGMVRGVDVGWNKVLDLKIGLSKSSDVLERCAVNSENGKEQIRIVRTAINGIDARTRVVFNREIDLTGRAYISEADVIRNGNYDLDWSSLERDAKELNLLLSDVNKVDYKIIVGGTSIDDATNVVAEFSKEFPSIWDAPVPVSPSQDSYAILLSAQPTFVWKDDGGYTAYEVQIADENYQPIWTSGIQVLPAAGVNGYEYRAPVYVGRELDDNSMYFWRVVEFNAKFNTNSLNRAWSEWARFETSVDSTDLNTGYGKLQADVRYYGPCYETCSNVIVGVYKSKDFTDTPVASLRLAGGDLQKLALSGISGFASVQTNNLVTFDGIAPGEYYVMAFVDANGNVKRDRYEIWGYANNIGKGVADIYTPQPFAVTADTAVIQGAVVFMEDTDINQNGIPDFEDCMRGEIDTTDEESVEQESESWEDFYNIDLQSDSEYAAKDDVMAYYDLPVYFVTIGEKVGEVGIRYAIVDNGETPKIWVGANASSLTNLISVYAYGDLYGLGTNVSFATDSNLKVIGSAKAGTVRLVHAQVCSYLGFSENTCIPDDDAINTKKFTAQDKYLVCRYLENIGFTDVNENEMNLAKEWSEYTLEPGVIDGDGDGIPDGWELYVMLGTNALGVAVNANLSDAEISPFNGNDSTNILLDAEITVAEAYDNGNYPTNPWVKDTDNDGVSDKNSYKYHLKSGMADQDADHDGLSNYAEYLITEVFGYAKCDPDNAYTVPGTMDYFQRIGSLYLGELFTDHDHMEDEWEDEQDTDFVNRYQYDANRDDNENGWSNWAEARAVYNEDTWVQVSTKTNLTVLTFEQNSAEMSIFMATNMSTIALYEGRDKYTGDWEQRDSNKYTGNSGYDKVRYTIVSYEPIMAYGGRPNPHLKIMLRYNGDRVLSLASNNTANVYLILKAYTDDTLIRPDAVFRTKIDSTLKVATYELKDPIYGYLREGKATLVGYLTSSSSAESSAVPDYDPQAPDPFGIVMDAEIGWSGNTIELEVTDASSVFDRMNVKVGTSARTALRGDYAGNVRDRDAKGALETIVSDVELTHIRIVPYKVKGTTTNDKYEDADGYIALTNLAEYSEISVPVAEFDVSDDLPIIHEGKILSEGVWDLDWDGFESRIYKNSGVKSGIGDVTHVLYRMYVGNSSNQLVTLVEKRFETTAGRTIPEAISPGEGGDQILGHDQPTFSWYMNEDSAVGEFGCSYTAFKIQVMNTNGTEVIYDSGYQRAPVKDATGAFRWTAPIYVGEYTPTGKLFANGKSYTWRVSMYNSKFKSDKWSSVQKFTTKVNTVTDVDDGGYSAIGVCLKYIGPATGTVRVEAFTTPDFTGSPVSRASTNVVAAITNDSALANMKLIGLKEGTYYVRAYLDSDGDFAHSDWESWGYHCYQGDRTAAHVFMPKPVMIGATDTTNAVIGVFVEDADTDQDGIPDAYEYELADGAEDFLNVTISSDDTTLAINREFADKFAAKQMKTGLSTGLNGSVFSAIQDSTIASLMLGGGLDLIRSAVDMLRPKIVENTVKITGVTLRDDQIILTVDADTASEVNGTVASVYELASTKTVTVTCIVWKKTSLDDDDWSNACTKTITIDPSTSGTEVSVDLTGVDVSSGFFKVELKQ